MLVFAAPYPAAASSLVRLGASDAFQTGTNGEIYQDFALGCVYTAAQSFTATRLHHRAGATGHSNTIRVSLYAMPASGNVWGALLGTVDIAGGFTALQERSNLLSSAVSIVAGNRYGFAIQASAYTGSASWCAGASEVFYADAYADGPMNPGPSNPGLNSPRGPYVWASNEP